MKIKTSKRISFLSALSVSTLWISTAIAQSSPEESGRDHRWSFSAGPLFRQFDGGQFRSGSRSSSNDIPGGQKTYTLSTGAAGPESGEVLREYSDGFVGPDTAGTTPASLFENTTSRYGYDNNSQNNADTTLVFQGPLTGEQNVSSTASSRSDLSWSDSSDYEPGAVLEWAYRLTPSEDTVTFLGQFSILYSPLEISGGGSTFEARRTDTRKELSGTLTDSYQVPTGVILPLAPYSQASANPPPGFYPRIADEPTRSIAPESRTVSSNTLNWFNQIEESVEADVFTFSFGPEVQLDVMDAGFVSLSAGAALHMVDWKASHEETLVKSTNGGSSETVRTWKDQSSGTDLAWGGFAQVSGGVVLGPDNEPSRYFVQAFARWEITEDVEGKVGPSEFTLHLDSFSAGAMAGFYF
ncbi:MAG: hypothetical protein PF795_13345 [Kiritimatiellae bacterium]|jgi:hypothetical protein|nr:hypothetical protein [Kiritimatiellia bacterium]